MSLLQVTLGAGATGAVITLAGEADRASPARLAEILDAQLSGHADADSIRVLAAAAVGHVSTTAGSPALGSPPPGPCGRRFP